MISIRKIGIGILATGALVLSAGAGVASASPTSPNSIPSSSGTFYGCVKPTTDTVPGALIVKDDGGTGSISCGASDTEIQWSQGSTAGSSGLDVTQVSNTASGNPASAVATCPTDHPFVLGGGGSANSGVSGDALAVSEPDSTNAWVVESNISNQSTSVTAYAICAK